MSAFYTALRAMATRLLTERGTIGELRKLESDGTLAAQHEVRVVKAQRTRHTQPGSEVQIGDWLCLGTAQDGVTYEPNDLIMINGKEHTVVFVEPVEPADINVVWFFWARLGI